MYTMRKYRIYIREAKKSFLSREGCVGVGFRMLENSMSWTTLPGLCFGDRDPGFLWGVKVLNRLLCEGGDEGE